MGEFIPSLKVMHVDLGPILTSCVCVLELGAIFVVDMHKKRFVE